MPNKNSSKLQQQITQILAEAHNLLAQARLDGIQGSQLVSAAKIVEGFNEVIQGLSSGDLIIYETDVDGLIQLSEEEANEAE